MILLPIRHGEWVSGVCLARGHSWVSWCVAGPDNYIRELGMFSADWRAYPPLIRYTVPQSRLQDELGEVFLYIYKTW